MKIGGPQMFFGSAVTLFAKVANVQSVTEVAFTDFFGKKANFCHHYSFPRAQTPLEHGAGLFLRTENSCHCNVCPIWIKA